MELPPRRSRPRAARRSAAARPTLRAAHGAHSALPGALTDGFSRAFMVAAGFAVLGTVLALLFVQNSRPAAGDKIVSADAEESLATTAA